MKIAIIGLGQLGGSLALAVKEHNQDAIVSGYDINESYAKTVLEEGGLDAIYNSPSEAVNDADLVFLACPLTAYQNIISVIHAHLKPGAIISDVGSVQSALHKACANCDNLDASLNVIPSHPIAGTENAGPQAASAALFTDRLVLLTPENPETDAASTLANFWSSLGAKDVLMLPASLHDVIYAHVSHLPHMIAYAAASTLRAQQASIEKDDVLLHNFLRIARSSPNIWADIACKNSEALSLALANCCSVLEHMATELTSAPEQPSATDISNATLAKTYLPQLASSAVVTCVSMLEMQHQLNIKPFSGTGLEDVIAPAKQAPEEALANISNHAHSLALPLQHYVEELGKLKTHIQHSDHAALTALLAAMQQDAALLTRQHH